MDNLATAGDELRTQQELLDTAVKTWEARERLPSRRSRFPALRQTIRERFVTGSWGKDKATSMLQQRYQ